MIQKIICVLIGVFLVSCARPLEGPTIYFSNASPKKITGIQSNWAGQNLLSLTHLSPGDTRSQTFKAGKMADFFGDIRVSWYNADGVRISREFRFSRNNLPSISDPTTYSYVQFYLEQEEFEIMSSDAPDLPGKIRKMDRLLQKYSAKDTQPKEPKDLTTSLIRIEPRKNKKGSIPAWLGSAY